MQLNIRNFAKIKEADIIIDGITIIAGENNTGKSTVGKVLFSLFNVFSDIDKKILNERLEEIEKTNRVILQDCVNSIRISRERAIKIVNSLVREINLCIAKELENNLEVLDKTIFDIVKEVIKKWTITTIVEERHSLLDVMEQVHLVEAISKNTSEILALPEKKIVLEMVSRYFNNVFHSQIKSLTNKETEEAILSLKIGETEETLFFANNNCTDFIDEVNISNKAIYIDNPFLVDELSNYNHLNPMNELLKNLLKNENKNNSFSGIIGTIRAKEKLHDIYETLQKVVDGEIILNQNDEFYLKNNNFQEPISFHNLSTGLKSFVILKMLLEKGCLKEKDVVILDEPEVHLHPQWQIAYAELIVLLQKQFDLSVIVTTHSPYFVDAIHLFSCKYGTESKVNYYLSSNNNDRINMDLVTKNIDLIYKKMASPIQMLDTLRYELNNNKQ